jgi:hypothetical protein
MLKLDCPFCAPDLEKTLILLPTSNREYHTLVSLSDGTKKGFLCEACDGVFFYDKMTDTWQVSAMTYDKFVKEGKLKDQLNED